MELKDPNRAVELLKGALALVTPVYLCGEAYLALGDGDRAATEFQKLIDRRGMVTNDLRGALARLGLARAYAMQGNTAKARAAYQDFLSLWKDADRPRHPNPEAGKGGVREVAIGPTSAVEGSHA